MYRMRLGRGSASHRSGTAGRAIGGLLLAFAMLQGSPAEAGRPGKRPVAGHAVPGPAAQAIGSEAVIRAVALVGVPYRWGGSHPATGLDCSGLVHHVFGEIGLSTARDTRGLSRSGATVSRKGLVPGDLVFFNTLRRAYSHVGIYLGDGRFVHAPSSGAVVRIESMNTAYWRQRYNGARRLVPAHDTAPAQRTRLASAPASAPASATTSAPPDEERAAVAAAPANPSARAAMAQAPSVASFYRY